MPNVISGGQLQALESPTPNLPAGWGPVEVHQGPIGSWGELPRLGLEDPINIWRSQPSVRKVVDFIARAIASTPIKVYQRVSDTDRQRLTNHPLPRVLNMAPGVVPYRVWHAILVDWLLYDRWTMVKTATTDARRPIDLTRVQSARTKFADDGLGRVSLIWVDGKLRLDPADCLFDHGYAPFGANGTTPMATLSAILQESREAVDYRRKVWANAGRVPAVLTRPVGAPQWSDTAQQNFVAEWRKYTRGGGSEGGTPILQDGMTLAQVETFSPRDAEDLSGRQLNDAEVSSAYHIAPELVGARQGNYSNVAAFREALYGDALGPYFVAVEQVVNAMLVPDLDDTGEVYAEFDLDSKMRGSFETQAAVLSTAIGRPWMTAAEGRARVNLPDIGGDTNALVTPLNVLVGGQASPRDTGTQNTPLGQSSRGARGVKGRAPDTHQQKAEQVLTGFFEKQRDEVLSALGRKADGDWWDETAYDAALAADLYRLSVQTSTEVGKATAESLGFTPGDYDIDRTLAFLRAVADKHAADINAATKAQIDAALASSDDNDTPEAVFALALAQRVPSAASRLVTANSGFGTHEAASQLVGEKASKTWLTGEHPRPSHAAMDGETVPLSENFSNGLAWPGDGGDPDEVAGCNCGVSVRA